MAASILTLVLLLGSCADGDNVYDSMRRIESDDAPAYNSVRLEQIQLDSVRYSGESFSWAQEGQEYAAWTYSMAGFIGSMLRGV